MNKPVIICIDDELIVLESLKRELSKSLEIDLDIELAQGGKEALELVKVLLEENCQIVLAISDYIMPDLKGDEVLKAIHSLSPNTLKIMLTGQTNFEGVANAINSAKLYRYISKPWQSDDLKLTVKEAIKSYFQARYLEEKTLELEILNKKQASLIKELQINSQILEQKVRERTKKLAIAKEKAEVANKAKSTFLANMSHELRTPLNAILGFSQLMGSSPNLSEDEQENINIINRSGEYLLGLINNILDLAKIEAGKTTLNPTNFDLHALFKEVQQLLRLRAENKNLLLHFEWQEDVPKYVSTDEIKLRQVLINLINNAIKFTTLGGIIVKIQVFDNTHKNLKDNKQKTISFEIQDTGIGIALEEQHKLFEAFSQTNSGKEANEGTGLGLAISRHFVRLMGGEMTVSSQLGVGTTFFFHIPVKLVNSAEIITKTTLPKVIGLKPNQPLYRILVVDDKYSNRQLLVKLLTPLGLDVKEAKNGQEAIEIWDQWEPHLIWMDMRMPILDGYEATKQIKGTTKGSATAIIALTASVLDDEKSIILSAGCDDFVKKPFREPIIFETMTKHLGIQYLYQDHQKQEGNHQEDLQSSEITSTSLKVMPKDWNRKLYNIALEADTEMITQLIEEIPLSYNALKATLTNWLHNYQFEKIIELSQASINNE